ncbi:MAG: hypothetical protein ABIV26_01795 [Candidatus Limnocylindrales bacterium]
MRTAMRRISALVLLVLASFTLGAAPAAAAGATTTVERYTVALGFVAEPHHDCITEYVRWQGGYELLIVTVHDPAGGTTRTLHYRQRMSGVGLSTGTRYVVIADYSETVRTSDTSNVYTFPISYHELSYGGSANYLSTAILHFTTNALGEPVSTVELSRVSCVG